MLMIIDMRLTVDNVSTCSVLYCVQISCLLCCFMSCSLLYYEISVHCLESTSVACVTLRCLPQGKDDITGEPLIQHDDDKPEALMARLRHYKDVAKPVIDLYKSVNTFLSENKYFFTVILHSCQPCSQNTPNLLFCSGSNCYYIMK